MAVWYFHDALEFAIILYWPATLILSAAIVLIWVGKKRTHSKRRRYWLLRLGSVTLGAILAGMIFELAGVAYAVRSQVLAPLPHFAGADHDDEKLIVAIGGSTMVGEPYHEKLSLPAIVARKMNQLSPKLRYSVEMIARRGDDLEFQYNTLAKLKRRPDVLLIYSGHNEFTRKFRACETYAGWWDAWRRGTPGLRMTFELLNRAQVSRPPRSSDRSLFDAALLAPERKQRCYDNFRRRIHSIVQWAKRESIFTVLIVPASNEFDFDPSRTVAPAFVVNKEEDYRLLLGQLRSGAVPVPLPMLSSQVEGLAEFEFYAGRLAGFLGNVALAETLLHRALDHDAFPMRASTTIQQTVRETGRLFDVRVIDTPQLLRKVVTHDLSASLLGEYWFHDAHHLRLNGLVLLANEVVDVLVSELADPGDDKVNDAALTEAQVEEMFQITPMDWFEIQRSRANWYTTTFGLRYDSEFRAQRARKCAQLAAVWRARAETDERGHGD